MGSTLRRLLKYDNGVFAIAWAPFEDEVMENVVDYVEIPDDKLMDQANFSFSFDENTREIIESQLFFTPPELSELEKTKLALQAAVERQDFLEDCLTELIQEVYST